MSKILNVQEQNTYTKQYIYQEVLYWRTHELPELVKQVCQEQGVNLNTCIFIYLAEDYHGLPFIHGQLMTDDYRIIDFDISYHAETKTFQSLDCWRDITEDFNFSAHNKGYGKGTGLLIKEILDEVNRLELNDKSHLKQDMLNDLLDDIDVVLLYFNKYSGGIGKTIYHQYARLKSMIEDSYIISNPIKGFSRGYLEGFND